MRFREVTIEEATELDRELERRLAASPASNPPRRDRAMADKTIKSPYPGTFYRRPSPEADPYVSEGDRSRPETSSAWSRS